MRRQPSPLRPDRIRRIERPFGWIPFRILSSGLLGQLSIPAKLLFFFLCLVSDQQGISFYGPRRMIELLGLSASEITNAVGELRDADLLAFDGQVYQLLSLPPWLSIVKTESRAASAQAGRSVRDGPKPIGQLMDEIVGKG